MRLARPRPVLVALALALPVVSVPAQLNKRLREEARGLIRLETEILRQRYCATSDPSVDVMVLELRLVFTAVGSRPVIIPRSSSIRTSTWVRSRSP